MVVVKVPHPSLQVAVLQPRLIAVFIFVPWQSVHGALTISSIMHSGVTQMAVGVGVIKQNG